MYLWVGCFLCSERRLCDASEIVLVVGASEALAHGWARYLFWFHGRWVDGIGLHGFCWLFSLGGMSEGSEVLEWVFWRHGV